MASLQDNYAAALAVLVKKDPSTAVEKLTQLLKAKGRLQLVSKVIAAYKKLSARSMHQHSLRLSVARAQDAAAAESAARAALGSKADGATFNIAIDETLIGGWRVEGKAVLIDASHKKHLQSLYQKVITH